MSVPRAPGDVGVHVGPLDPAGATYRHELCCPYCASLLAWAGQTAGLMIAHADRYECANCHGVWRIRLESSTINVSARGTS